METVRAVHRVVNKKEGKDGGKWEQAKDLGSKGRITWLDASSPDLMAAIAAVTEDGAAILLSKTSDGGALVVHILSDQGRAKWYPASATELATVLRAIQEIASQRN